MLIDYKRGQGSVVLRVKVLDTYAANGAGLTGLAYNTSGLYIAAVADNESSTTAYTVAANNIETIATLGTYAAPTSGKCRFKELDSTYHKGVYEIQLADAHYAVSNAKSLTISLGGAANAAETDVTIPLRGVDPFNAANAGLTCLPSAAAGAANGLTTLDSSGHLVAYSVTSNVNANLNAANVTGNLPADVERWAAGSLPTFPTNFSSLAVTAAGLVAIDNAALVDAVWDEATSGHTTSGTTGKAITDAQSSGDPWITALPGSYTSGTAGYIVGTNLNATVSSRSTLAAGAQMDLINSPNATARSAIATSVWSAGTRTLTSLGTLAADSATAVWAYSARTLTGLGIAVADIAAAVWDELLAGHTTTGSAGAKLAASASNGAVINSSPVSLNGTELYLTIGYDYTNGSDSQPCAWSDSDGAWPNLSGATVSLLVKDTRTGNAAFTVTGNVSGAGTSSQSVSANVTAADTSLMEAEYGRYPFYLQATWSSDNTTRLLAWGWVFPRQSPPKTLWG